MRPAHGKRRWRPVQAGRPRAGTIPISATRGDSANTHLQIDRLNLLRGIPAHHDRRRAHRASSRQRLAPAQRSVAGIELAPRLLMAVCPAQERRRSIQLSLRGVQPFRLHPVPLRRREPELEPKAGEGGCRRGCPRPVPHSRNPGDRHARPRKRYPRHPTVPTRTLARQCAQDAGRCFGLHRAQGLDRRPRATREPDCPHHGTRPGWCRALRGDRWRPAACLRCRRWPPRARWKRTTPCPAA